MTGLDVDKMGGYAYVIVFSCGMGLFQHESSYLATSL